MPSINIWEIWKRADTGPICPSNKFLTQVTYPRLEELVKEFGIYQKPEEIVPTDDSLIDNCFEAGVRFLLDVGVLCIDTERIIKLEDWEVKEAIRNAPKEVVMGEGRDIVKMKSRKLEDRNDAPVLARFNGPASSEEISFKVYLSMAKESLINMINTQANLKFIDGMPVKAGAPSEIYCEIRNASLGREAIRRAGRPGMPLWRGTATSAAADIASSSIEHGYRDCDVGNLSILPGLQTNYMMLNKAAHYLEYGCPTYSLSSWEIETSPEISVIGSVAAHIATLLIYQVDIAWSRAGGRRKTRRRVSRQIGQGGMTSRNGLWGTLLLGAVSSKNNLLHMGPGTTLCAGCGSEMVLYELANATIGSNAVGSQIGQGMGHFTRKEDYISGLEGRFTGEVNHATVGIKRKSANDFISTILKKYEHKMERESPDLGMKFQECYDLHSITPKKKYIEIYNQVKSFLQNIGIEIE
jgi:methylamine--corrinoid protein Co-methyltransferase